MNFSMRRLAKELGGESTTTITVAKAYCTPSRNFITNAFSPLHIWFDMPPEDTAVGHDPLTGFPVHQKTDIVVKRKQAAWAEYVLLSIKDKNGKPVFQVLSRPKNPKNAAWAAKRKGIPPPWDLKRGKGSAWVERECSKKGKRR